MYIPQKQLKKLTETIFPGKVVVLYGPRRVGKTTLLKQFVRKIEKHNPKDTDKILFVNGDDIVVRQYLESQSIQKLKELLEKLKF